MKTPLVLSNGKKLLARTFISMTVVPTHPPLDSKSADTRYSAPQKQSLNRISDVALLKTTFDPSMSKRFSRGPDVEWTKPLMLYVGHDGGLVIIGSAVHSFHPDRGQDLSSALVNVAVFAAALPPPSESASVRNVISDY